MKGNFKRDIWKSNKNLEMSFPMKNGKQCYNSDSGICLSFIQLQDLETHERPI